MADPRSGEQWQEAVDVAQGILAVELAQRLGLITGQSADVARCAEILTRGAERGIRSHPDAVRDWIIEMPADDADRTRLYRVVSAALEMSGHPDLAAVVPFMGAPDA